MGFQGFQDGRRSSRKLQGQKGLASVTRSGVLCLT
jgi:hypothetical protein